MRPTCSFSTRRSLKDLCERSAAGGRRFVPEGKLATILTLETIYNLLCQDSTISAEELVKRVDEVHSRALKVFAILISLESEEFLAFFLDKKLYDDKLPFSNEHFDSGPDTPHKKWIEDFLYEQHKFLAPIFVSGNSYAPMDSKWVLPYCEYQDLGEGASADVYKVLIHASHQRLKRSQSGGYEARWFAVKVFKPQNGKRYYEKEKRILEQLLKLKHPNILPLLATYGYGGRFCMIFPLAEKTLFEYLRSDVTPNVRLLFEKIRDLIAGLDHLHNFTFEEDGKVSQLQVYHHDLKPQNILVHEGQFVIADFGLANFKNADQSSKTSWKAFGAYSPPGARDGGVGRAYDIWSLGCMMLELITLAAMGAKGVRDFAQNRLTQVTSTMANDYFHDGHHVKLEVSRHIHKLKTLPIARTEPMIPRALKLVEQMLVPDANQRPVSRIVLKKFRRILDTPERPLSFAVPASNSNSNRPLSFPGSGFDSFKSSSTRHHGGPSLVSPSSSLPSISLSITTARFPPNRLSVEDMLPASQSGLVNTSLSVAPIFTKFWGRQSY